MSVYPKCQCSQRPLSQGAFLSTPSVAANKEPRPKELFCQPQVSRLTEPRPKGPFFLPQVSILMKSHILRSFSVYPKCQCSQRGSFQGALLSTPSVDAYEEPPP